MFLHLSFRPTHIKLIYICCTIEDKIIESSPFYTVFTSNYGHIEIHSLTKMNLFVLYLRCKKAMRNVISKNAVGSYNHGKLNAWFHWMTSAWPFDFWSQFAVFGNKYYQIRLTLIEWVRGIDEWDAIWKSNTAWYLTNTDVVIPSKTSK